MTLCIYEYACSYHKVYVFVNILGSLDFVCMAYLSVSRHLDVFINKQVPFERGFYFVEIIASCNNWCACEHPSMASNIYVLVNFHLLYVFLWISICYKCACELPSNIYVLVTSICYICVCEHPSVIYMLVNIHLLYMYLRTTICYICSC